METKPKYEIRFFRLRFNKDSVMLRLRLVFPMHELLTTYVMSY